MTIHVNIGEAKTRLSALLAAARRGEEVVINRNGKPDVRLVPVDHEQERLNEIAAKRLAAFGMWKGQISQEALDMFLAPTISDEEAEAFDVLPHADEDD